MVPDREIITILQNSALAILVTDSEKFVVQFSNNPCNALLSDPNTNLAGQKLSDICPEFGKEGLQKSIRDVVTSRTSTTIREVELTRSGQTLAVADLAVQTILDQSKANTLVMITILPLRQPEKTKLFGNYRAMKINDALEAANIGVGYYDVRSHELILSEEQEKLFGFEPGKFDGDLATLRKLIHPEDLLHLEKTLKENPNAQDVIEVEYRIQKLTGETRWIFGKFKVDVDAQGNPVYVSGISTDITNLKEKDKKIKQLLQRESAALQAFYQREETFRLLIENSKDGISLTDAEGDIIYISPSVKSILGYSEEEMVNMKGFANIHPDDIPEIVSIFTNFKDGESVTHEFRMKHKDGHYLWVESTTTNFLNMIGISAVVSNFRDITERRAAQEEIAKNEKQFHQLSNALPQLVWMADPDGVVFYYNDRIREYAGAQLQDDKTWHWSPLVHPDDELSTVEAWSRAVLEKTEYVIEHRVKMKDGSYRYHLSRAFPQFDSGGKVLQWYGTATDIHEQKQAQRILTEHASALEEKVKERTSELRKQKDLAEAVLYASVDLIAIYDTETRLITANQKFFDTMGFQRHEITGKKLLEFIPAADEAHQRLLKVLAGEYIYLPTHKSRIINAYYEAHLIPLKDDEGNTYAALVISHDITDTITTKEILQSNAQQLKVANEALLKKNQELEQFAYVASHDLQEPLRKISTFARMLEKNLEVNPENTRKYLEKIIQSSNRMSQLINDVLLLSQLSKAEAFALVDLNEVLQNIQTDLELMVEQKNATITSTQLPVIEAVPRQISQLFYNLISNSLKFTKDDTPATVHISCTILEAGPGDTESVKITFADNGIGFNEAYGEKIFQMFQRLNTKEQFSGSGIGLAMVKKIVSSHNGMINVESEEGVGSRFHIILPIKQPIAY